MVLGLVGFTADSPPKIELEQITDYVECNGTEFTQCTYL